MPMPSVATSAPRTPLGVLVTGAAGFIGASLVRRAIRGGHLVTAIDARPGPASSSRAPSDARVLDLTQSTAWLEALACVPRERILHLAGFVGVARVLAEPERCRRVNDRLVQGLCSAVASTPVGQRPRVLCASTSEVYHAQMRPILEQDPVLDGEARGRWAYAASKIACERMLDESGLWPPERAPVHLRFFNVVGPGQDSRQGMMLPTFVEHALAGRPIPVHGDGSQVRTLAHVDEVAETLCDLIELEHLPGGPLNVGGTARASVLEIAECVLALSGSKAGLVHVDPKRELGPEFEDIAWREPDLTRLRSLSVTVPSQSLEDIVKDTLERHETLRPRGDPCGSRAS